MSSTHLLRAAMAAHQPEWHSLDLLRGVLYELGRRPGLVGTTACESLRHDLARAGRGEAFVLQAGDCAERFADAAASTTRRKIDQFDGLTALLGAVDPAPVVRIGRIAGQYAKPRSCATEILPDGTSIPVYRGDAVNAEAPSAEDRVADPLRLLHAYDRSAEVLDVLEEYAVGGGDPVYSSHEALLLEYEESLVRTEPGGGRIGSSAHLLWVGDRTRQLDHAHVDFLRSVRNPVAVKIGPSVGPGDATALVHALAPDQIPGRLTFVVRMGLDLVREHLNRILSELGDQARDVVWLVDPMHGNTLSNSAGQKTRVVDDMLGEIDEAADVLRNHECRLSGLHLETSPDPVTECVDTHEDLVRMSLPDYRSACDPRLGPAQAATVVEHAARVAGSTASI